MEYFGPSGCFLGSLSTNGTLLLRDREPPPQPHIHILHCGHEPPNQTASKGTFFTLTPLRYKGPGALIIRHGVASMRAECLRGCLALPQWHKCNLEHAFLPPSRPPLQLSTALFHGCWLSFCSLCFASELTSVTTPTILFRINLVTETNMFLCKWRRRIAHDILCCYLDIPLSVSLCLNISISFSSLTCEATVAPLNGSFLTLLSSPLLVSLLPTTFLIHVCVPLS